MTVGDQLINRLSSWGVVRIYGYPGDGINGIMGALERARDRVRFVQVRHEEMAAFMACAHAKFTGEVGVCLATSGPGAIHLISLSSQSSDRPRVPPSAAAISRKSISRRSSRTSRTSSSRRR
jgi:glyoxylate carboligase